MILPMRSICLLVCLMMTNNHLKSGQSTSSPAKAAASSAASTSSSVTRSDSYGYSSGSHVSKDGGSNRNRRARVQASCSDGGVGTSTSGRMSISGDSYDELLSLSRNNNPHDSRKLIHKVKELVQNAYESGNPDYISGIYGRCHKVDRSVRNLLREAIHGDNEYLEILLQAGIRCDIADMAQLDRPDLFFEFCEGGSWNLARPRGCADWCDPVLVAAKNAGLNVLTALRDQGFDFGVVDEDGNTSLHYAAHNSRYEGAVKFILACGVSVDVTNSYGASALHWASEYSSCSKILQLLIESGICIDSVDHRNRTPLHNACSRGCAKNIRALIGFGASLTVQDNNGKTPGDIYKSLRDFSSAEYSNDSDLECELEGQVYQEKLANAIEHGFTVFSNYSQAEQVMIILLTDQPNYYSSAGTTNFDELIKGWTVEEVRQLDPAVQKLIGVYKRQRHLPGL